MDNKVVVIGGGLAGCEAAWQAAKVGCNVTLYEMRPDKNTGAHHTADLAEIVCSNSLGSNAENSAPGLLKEELRKLDSLIISCADSSRVAAGQALAVNRLVFSKKVTEAIQMNPNIEVIREEIKEIPCEKEDEVVVLATGPLTSDSMSKSICELIGEKHLYFFDAAAPIVDAESVDMNSAFWGSRYDKGDPDYLNCPMTEEEYNAFYDELIEAELAPVHDFEKNHLFESCMPVEEIARRGRQTLLFGPLKPVGLTDPHTGKRPFALLQLRREDEYGSSFNMVGFQTRLKWGEQKRVFGMIPALSNAEFLRFGVMHRNTFINSPEYIDATMQYRLRNNLLFAGQMTGVEGYMESTASGLVAGLNAGLIACGKNPVSFGISTAIGALCRHISVSKNVPFQPSNINFGLLPSPEGKYRKNEKKEIQIAKAREEFKLTLDMLQKLL